MMITISREYGAGGSFVAARVAEQLGWRVVDSQLLEEVAKRAGLTTDEVREREERGPTFVERLALALAAETPRVLGKAPDVPEKEEARLVKITEQVLAEAAADHVVLVGRAAVAVIGDKENALHVKLVGSVEYRAQVIADREKLTFEEAQRRVRDVDAHRASYHRQYYSRDWTDPRNYHLVLNTGWLGPARAADVIVACIRLRY
ncbi:MAG TPA: cytidylate kinase-like family protein [Gemmatimonadales bacterium]|nr:cytidylate kinase-like family protein [Gemmatimonadales bacterium]